MAHFKIKLLTSKLDGNNKSPMYLETPLSDFDEQLLNKKSNTLYNTHTYCYTFDEKISLHTNGQKTLSFSMVKNIWLDNEMTTNPFISKVKNGSQLLLIDQYDNEYFFTVSDIQYTLKQSNIIYTYTCQDSFSYQHIRQHSGYTIENDPSSSTYIGARNIDWWVVNKVKPECHISYEYVPMSRGLYISKDNNLTIFKSGDSLKNVNKIVKPIFTQEEYPELYEEFPFSTSGSNAASALIALADELGLMLNFREHNVKTGTDRSQLFVRYFWFEPKKNERNANLKYSPNTDIQTFSFTHKGSSLTTIFNVDSNTINDEVVSLIPSVPPFFSSLFSSSYWKDSIYGTGFFEKICQEELMLCEDGIGYEDQFRYDIQHIESIDSLSKITFQNIIENSFPSFFDRTNKYLYLHLSNKSNRLFLIPYFYDKVTFLTKQKRSEAIINSKIYDSTTSLWEFVMLGENDLNLQIFNDSYSLIPNNLMGIERKDCYLRIKVPSVDDNPRISESNVVLKFYRDATEDDLQFAKIADKCPWLENKLINFSYFLEHKILSKAEYRELMNSLVNNLRIINGQLLYYSNQYYKSIRDKTEEVSKLLNILDSTGAAFTSDAVEAYRTSGTIKNIEYFKKAYSTLQARYFSESDPSTILDYEGLVTEYFNKYFNAQQRFLKAMYNFKKTFNEKYSWSGGETMALYRATLELSPLLKTGEDNVPECYYSFNEGVHFQEVDENFNYWDQTTLRPQTHIFLKDRTTRATIVDKLNYTSFYTNTIDAGSSMRCSKGDGYISSQIYYKIAYKARKTFLDENGEEVKIDWPESFTSNDILFYKHQTDEENIWYSSAKPAATITEWPVEIEYNNIKLQQDFIPLSFKHIINEYVYHQLYKNNTLKWYYHDTNTDEEPKVWWNPNDIGSKLKGFLPSVFGNSFTDKEWESQSFGQLVKKIMEVVTGVEGNKTTDERVEFYKSHFPITSLKYVGPAYINKPYKIGNIEMWYQPVGTRNNSLTNYIDYLVDTTVYEKNNLNEIVNPLLVSEYQSYTIPIVNSDNASNYYRRVPKGGGFAFAGAVLAIDFIDSLWLDFNEIKNWKQEAVVKRVSTYNLWHKNTKWAQSGTNAKDFYDNTFNSGKVYLGFHDTNAFYYTKTSSAYDEWEAIKLHREGVGFDIAGVKIYTSDKEIEDGYTLWKTYSHNKKNFYLCYSTHTDFQDYFNFYSKIGLTYSKAWGLSNSASLSRGKKLLFKNGFLRPVKPSEPINSQYSYRILTLQDVVKTRDGDVLKNIIFADNYSIDNCLENGRLSKVVYYFLYNNTAPLDVTGASGTWGNMFDPVDENGYVYTSQNDNEPKKQFIIFQEEDFNLVKVYNPLHWANGIIKPQHRHSIYWPGEEIYNTSNQTIVNFSSLPDLTEGLYKSIAHDTGFIPAGDKLKINWDVSTDSTKFFTKNSNNEYERVYTIPQIKKLGGFYYISSDKYVEEVINPTYTYRPNIFLHKRTYQSGQLVTDLAKTFSVESDSEFVFNEYDSEGRRQFTTTQEFTFTWKDQEYKRNCTLTLEKISDITNTTKGDFWYKYHSYVDNPILFEEAASIEAQLTEYWQEAYSASLYCEYFLPSAWQPRIQGEVNHYSDNIIIAPASNDLQARLSNKYVPDVQIYSNGYTTQFPCWELQYKTELDKEKYSMDMNKQEINQNNDSPASVVLENVVPFKKAFEVLKDNMSNFIVLNANNDTLQHTRKKSYYYNANDNTGVKWDTFLQKHSTITDVYSNYSGLHVMAYWILKSHYRGRPISLYEKAKKEQGLLWNKLYQKYPGVLLEEVYSNPDATTSENLYLLATNAFMDKQEPERNYNISLINLYKDLTIKKSNNSLVSSYESYNNHELKIGDGILIDAEEYYDSYDDVYKTLSQYLFITDISYDLRRDDNMQLTVNNIKYQDKLIQRLVKLIK